MTTPKCQACFDHGYIELPPELTSSYPHRAIKPCAACNCRHDDTCSFHLGSGDIAIICIDCQMVMNQPDEIGLSPFDVNTLVNSEINARKIAKKEKHT